MCYHVLSLVHGEWDHMQHRVKDYVADPKANGYQSIHTTATIQHGGRTWPFEVQIRDSEM
jgi:GTP pyrophosphokinase